MEYASKGVGTAGVTLGIIGTALGALNAFGGNGVGLFNWGGAGAAGTTINNNLRGVSETDNFISDLQSQIAELKAMRYNDQTGIDLYKNIIAQSNVADAKINANMKEVMGYIVDLGQQVALNKQASEYETKILEAKLDCCCDKANIKIDNNAKLSELADASILSYVNSNFVAGTLKLPYTSIWTAPTNN